MSSWTIPTPLPEPNNFIDPLYEVPQFLRPIKIHSTKGNVISAESLTQDIAASKTNTTIPPCILESKLSSEEDASVILDFGVAVAGIPIIHVTTLESSNLPVRLQVAYSEAYPGIERPDGDGPFPFSAGADTMRRTTFRISHPGYHQAKYVQGSQRWMKITLPKKTASKVSLSLAGFKPTVSNLQLNDLPGFFQCSDESLSELWGYGARTLQLNCIPARSVPPPWEVSEDGGVLIESQRCNGYAYGSDWTDYEVEFEALIIESGFSWTVRCNRARPGLLFVLSVDEITKEATLELWFGYFNKPQITLVPTLITTQRIEGLQFETGKWYKVRTVCQGDKPIAVYIDSKPVGKFEQGKNTGAGGIDFGNTEAGIPATPTGTVGIGAGQDQISRFKNMTVVSLPSREVLYSSGLNNPAVLSDFGLEWNQLPFIMDGAKRDRYAWTADIITGGPSLYYSTAGIQYIKGNIEGSMLRIKAKEGEPSLLPGGSPIGKAFDWPSNDTMFEILSINYSLYLIMVIHDYWLFTGDHVLVAKYWKRIQGCLEYVRRLINKDGLVEAYGMDAGDYDYYNGIREGVSTKLNALYIAALRNSAAVALSPRIDDAASSKEYLNLASSVATAINKHLFDSQANHYLTSNKITTGIAQEAHSWLITQNIAPKDIHTDLITKLKEQLTPTTHNAAPLSFSPSTPKVPQVISPIMSAFHIVAAIHANHHSIASHILRTVFAPMLDKSSPYFTGTCWEFLNADGTPFKDQFCSYAQLFSVGPTFILSRYVLGVEPVEAGFERFRVWPRLRVEGVGWAQGRVPTPLGAGGEITVRWQDLEGDRGWRIWVRKPKGLVGVVVIPGWVKERLRRLEVDGQEKKYHDVAEGEGINLESEKKEIDVVVWF